MGECAAKGGFFEVAQAWPAPLTVVVNVGAGCYPPSRVRGPERAESDRLGRGGSGSDRAGAVADATADAELVSAMARGDTDALGMLYDRHAGHMLSLAKRIVATSAAAEDIVQDVFLEAWKKAKSYDAERGGVRSWLLLRTRSRCIDFRRASSQSRAS